MTGRIDHKKALLAELLPLMEANGAEPALLDAARAPGWIEQVTVENLEFLLRQHRELQDLRGRNAGLLARWLGSKGERGPDGSAPPDGVVP